MKKAYFISDIHLGYPNPTESLIRERQVIDWINNTRHNASEYYFVGDIFDFWWEWKKVVPAGFVRFLGTIAELTDRGIPVYFFIGNHDIWMKSYLENEIGVKIIRQPLVKKIAGKQFYITHGDGLGPGDFTYKVLKKLFHNNFLQWIFSRFHPNFSVGLAHLWSRSSRSELHQYHYYGHDKEWLVLHTREVLKKHNYQYFVYGHRHIPKHVHLSEHSAYINLGDWLINFTYGEFDGTNFELKRYFRGKAPEIITPEII